MGTQLVFAAGVLFMASVMAASTVKGESPDGGRLLSVDSAPPSAMFDAKGEFQFFVPGVPVGPRTPDPGLVVGFIDSGTTSTHPQLAGLVLEEKSFVDGPVRDEIGHGTWTMLVTFTANPEARFGFYSAKVTRDGSDLRATNVIAAFNWLISKGVRVVNVSLGFDRLTPDVQRLCQVIAQNETVLVVAAAGNGGPDIKVYPAQCGAKNILAVGELSQGKPTSTSGVGQVYAEPPKFLSHWAFLNERALEEIRAGHADEAVSFYQQSLAIKENATADYQLALIYLQGHDYEKAKPLAERAFALAPDDSMVNQTLGSVLYSLKDPAAAIPRFEGAIELDSKNQLALLNLARACIVIKDFKRAGQALDQAQANDPGDPMTGELRSWLQQQSAGH